MKKRSEVTQTLRAGCGKADPQTNKQTNTQTNKYTDRGDYNTLLSLARSFINQSTYCLLDCCVSTNKVDWLTLACSTFSFLCRCSHAGSDQRNRASLSTLPEFWRTSQTQATCSWVKPNIKESPPLPLLQLAEACLSVTAEWREDADGEHCDAPHDTPPAGIGMLPADEWRWRLRSYIILSNSWRP